MLLSVWTVSGFLGTFKQGETVNLITAVNETALNITVYDPDSVKLVDNQPMTQDGYRFNFTFENTTKLGTYIYDYCNNVGTCYVNDFEITPSGDDEVLGLYFLLIGGVYLIAFIGFFGKNEWVSILGGMGMLILGVYMVGNGIDVYRNYMTNAFSYFTIALGCIFTMIPLFSILKENLG